jgi:guanine deaminase
VQTHCSEGDWEHRFVIDRFGMTDTETLDRFGFLGRKSLLGHAPHLTDRDMDIFKARGSAVSHCPLSNAYFASAVFPLRAALERGLHVASAPMSRGGPSALFVAMRETIAASRSSSTASTRGSRGGTARQTLSRVDFREPSHATTGGGIASFFDRASPRLPLRRHRVDTRATEGSIRSGTI